MVKEGYKVLLIDGDPQGSLTDACGFEPESLKITIATIIQKIIGDEDYESDEGILYHKEGIHLLPANIELSGVEMLLFNAMRRELVLREYVERQKTKYDFILIDGTPSLGLLTLNTLSAADSVLIPVQSQYLPAKGLQLLLNTIVRVKKKLNPKLNVEGILLTLVDKRTNDAKQIEQLIRDTYGQNIRIFTQKIPISVKASESSSNGVSVYRYDPKGAAAEAYCNFTLELLRGANQ